MGASETEKALDKETWKSAEDISKITGIGAGSIRKSLNSLVNSYLTVKFKTIMINNNSRRVYQLK